ncbi:MAG: glycosyltransferase [Cyclobacteriaceae bacterium]|nr:glycosyltransferase [Cyclobacteriaceae bacterium]
MKKKNVLFILPSVNAGGAENYALRFINFCGTEKYKWTILTPNTKRGDLHDNFLNFGCDVIYQRLGYVNTVTFLKFYSLIKIKNFDTVCSFIGNFGGVPLTIARIAGVKNRLAWHRRSTNAFKNTFGRNMYNRISNWLIRLNATSILSNSKFALDQFYGSYQNNDERFQVIPNGVNPTLVTTQLTKEEARQKLGLPADKFIIGHVGRYDPAKNHETIFKVATKFKEKSRDVTFLFCGRGTDSQGFKARLEDYGIRDLCYCLGLTENIAIVYKSMDLFYFPSITEGQPNALIEAMLSGVSVLPSEIPPILEVLPEHAKNKMFGPYEWEKAHNKIEQMKMNENIRMEFIFQLWAEKKFNEEKCFEPFRKIITQI